MGSSPETEQFYWYNYKSRDWDANTSVSGKGYNCVGYLKEPTYETIERHDLRLKCYGSIDMLEQGAI